MTDAFAATENSAPKAVMSQSDKDAILAARGPATDANGVTAETAEAPYQLSAEKMMMDNLFILGMLFFIFYFILIRPQQKRSKIHRDMMKALSKGNKIITTGGIIGTIAKLDGDDVVVVEVAQGIKIRMARSSVAEVISEKSPGESANDN